jgi:recombination protein RecA
MSLKDLKTAISSIEKKFGKEQVCGEVPDLTWYSTGSLKLDRELGGGVPAGRIVELFGWESSGKSTLALSICKQVQEAGKIVAYIDAENALKMDYLKDMGVSIDDDKWLIAQPDNGEIGFGIVKELVSVENMGCIVIDSVSGMLPKAVMEGEVGDSKMGVHARLMSQECAKIKNFLKGTDCVVIFINQFREKIGVMFGDNRTTQGGNALKFYASIRCEVARKGSIKNGDGEEIGQVMRIKSKKNKVFYPHREAEIDLIYGKGFDTTKEILDLAVENGLIDKKGSWYSYQGTKLGQGAENTVDLLNDNPELVEELKAKIFKPEKNENND